MAPAAITPPPPPVPFFSTPSKIPNRSLRYVFAEPQQIPAGTELVCTGSWDNSTANPNNPDPTATVSWGQQTADEMMIGFFEYYER